RHGQPVGCGPVRTTAVEVLGHGLVLLSLWVLKPYADDYRFKKDEEALNTIIAELIKANGQKDRAGQWLPIPAKGGIGIGPADAGIRITVFLDYQCGPCRGLAQDLRMLAGLPEVAITWRHLPHGSPCNPYQTKNKQPEACRAARLAAATAGTPPFAQVHEWLI